MSIEIKDFGENRKILTKPMHPKVTNILMKFKTPSPSKIVSDFLQPISGDLNNRPKPVPISCISRGPHPVAKPEVTLNLSKNRIMFRRDSLKSNN